MMLDNNWYGHRYILANYCNEKDRLAYASIQHGWSAYYNYGYLGFNEDGTFGSNKLLSFPYLVWSEEIKNNCKNKGLKNVHSIGAPFIYLCELLKTEKYINIKQNSKGIIFFPSHNTKIFKDVKINHDKIIEEIEKTSEGPYTICIYDSDLGDPSIEIYKKKNWNIVSCGPRDDNFMLFKQYIEITKHEKVISTEICTPIFYAMYLKKKTKVLEESRGEIVFDRLDDRLRENEMAYDTKWINNSYKIYRKNLLTKSPSLFDDFLSAEEGFKLAKIELGFNSLRKPNELKYLLGWSNFLKKTLSIFISQYFSVKYGKEIRTGKKELV